MLNFSDSLGDSPDNFLLPQERIATRPNPKREEANLLSCLEGDIDDLQIRNLVSLLKEGDVLVLNDTKVLPARLYAKHIAAKHIAAKHITHSPEDSEAATAECESKMLEPTLEVTLAERIEEGLFRAFVKGKIKDKGNGEDMGLLRFDGGDKENPFFAALEGRDSDGLVRLRFQDLTEAALYDRLDKTGAMPLPPYMKRTADARDKRDYQTLFARRRGAFASPTAGRHLTPRLLEELGRKGIETLFVTLHVSLASFQPIDRASRRGAQGTTTTPRVARESVVVSAETYAQIVSSRKRGGRVLAVGTTVVRALESAALNGGAFEAETELMIAPGFSFRCVDLLLTNFHQAHATPLLLTCAFAGSQTVKRAYAHARSSRQYRFFSYGDACLFERG